MYKYLFNPRELLNQKPKAILLITGIIISSIAFSLFYLQTSLDMNVPVLFSLMKGFLFGPIGIFLAALFIWMVARMFGNKLAYISVVGAIALSYTTTLIFTLVGLSLYHILGWNTAMSCGITGVLAAFGPMAGVISRLFAGKKNAEYYYNHIHRCLCNAFRGLLNNLI